jgi:hypothetical protein
MIFECDDPAEVRQIIERLTALERRFELRQADDVYLLAGRDFETAPLPASASLEAGVEERPWH